MHTTQLAQFAQEVLRRGAEAVLPQHLADQWLDALLEEADRLASGGGDGDEEDEEADLHEDEEAAEDAARQADPGCAGMLSAVITLVAAQRGSPDAFEVKTETLWQYLECYALALAAERVSRSTDIALDPPTVANIFDTERQISVTRCPLGGA